MEMIWRYGIVGLSKGPFRFRCVKATHRLLKFEATSSRCFSEEFDLSSVRRRKRFSAGELEALALSSPSSQA
jgi:hypothetical protein